MEESKSSKSGNHDTRKSARIVCEESKAVRVATNQNFKHNKNDKSIKEAGKCSSGGSNSKKNKQNDVCPEKTGESKSCKTNSCIAGCKDLESNVQDQSHSQAKKLLDLPSTVENVKQSKFQNVDENPPNSHNSENDASTETLPTAQRGNEELKNLSREDASKINVNCPSVSSKSGLDQKPVEYKPMEYKPEDFSECCIHSFL